MTNSAYQYDQNGIRITNELVMPTAFVASAPPALESFKRYHEGFADALEKTQDPARRQAYAQIYNGFLSDYCAHCRTGGYAEQFVSGYNQKMARMGPVAQQAWAAARDGVSGDSWIYQIFKNIYDWKAPKDHPTGGISIGGVIGAGVGFMASKVFGQTGLIGLLAGGGMAIGFAYGGKLIQDYLVGTGKKDPNHMNLPAPAYPFPGQRVTVNTPAPTPAPDQMRKLAEAGGPNPGVKGGSNVNDSQLVATVPVQPGSNGNNPTL